MSKNTARQLQSSKQNKKTVQDAQYIDQIQNNINKISKENKELKDEIETEEKQITFENTQQIEKLQNDSSNYARLIENETKKNIELNKQIKYIEDELLESKKFMSSVNEYPKQLKKLKLLEHRLATSKQKNDTAIADIKRLREIINNECRERVIFDTVFKNLEIDLKKNDHELRNHISVSMSVDNKLQECQNDLDMIQKQATMEDNHFEKQYQQVFQGNNSMVQNQTSNILDSTQLKNNEVRETTKQDKKNNRDQKKDKEPHKQQQQQYEDYSIFLEKFRKDTLIDDINQFIDYFQNMNQINTELYDDTNKLNDEIEKFQIQKEQLQLQIKSYEQQKEEKKEDPCESELQEYKAQYDEIKGKLDKNQEIREKQLKEFQSLSNTLLSIFDFFKEEGCINESISQQNLSQMTICHYQSIAEEKCSKINYIYNMINNNNQNDAQNKAQDLQSLHSQNSKQPSQNDKINNLISQIEVIPESFKIMSKNDFQNIGDKELNRYINKIQKKNSVVNVNQSVKK